MSLRCVWWFGVSVIARYRTKLNFRSFFSAFEKAQSTRWNWCLKECHGLTCCRRNQRRNRNFYRLHFYLVFRIWVKMQFDFNCFRSTHFFANVPASTVDDAAKMITMSKDNWYLWDSAECITQKQFFLSLCWITTTPTYHNHELSAEIFGVFFPSSTRLTFSSPLSLCLSCELARAKVMIMYDGRVITDISRDAWCWRLMAKYDKFRRTFSSFRLMGNLFNQ